MAEVKCTVIEDNNFEYGEGVVVTCSKCDYSTNPYGTSEKSIKRGLAMLREECPLGETNFYVQE